MFDDAADDLGRIVDMVDNDGAVLLLRDGKPAYVMVSFDDVEEANSSLPGDKPEHDGKGHGKHGKGKHKCTCGRNPGGYCDHESGECACDHSGEAQPQAEPRPDGCCGGHGHGGHGHGKGGLGKGHGHGTPGGCGCGGGGHRHGDPRPEFVDEGPLFGIPGFGGPGFPGGRGLPGFGAPNLDDLGAAFGGHPRAKTEPTTPQDFSHGQPGFLPPELNNLIPEDVMQAGQNLVNRLVGLFGTPNPTDSDKD